MSREPDLDDAIDRAVREIMSLEPRQGLRARVLDRLARPAPRWPALPRLAAAAAMIILVLAAFMIWRSRPEPAGPATIASTRPAATPAAPPAPGAEPPSAAAPRTPEAGPAATRTREVSTQLARPPRGRVAAAGVEETVTFPPAEAPSAGPPDALVQPIVIPEIVIERLTISRIDIAPINPPR